MAKAGGPGSFFFWQHVALAGRGPYGSRDQGYWVGYAADGSFGCVNGDNIVHSITTRMATAMCLGVFGLAYILAQGGRLLIMNVSARSGFSILGTSNYTTCDANKHDVGYCLSMPPPVRSRSRWGNVAVG
jgi:hypothetical protein